MDRRQQSGGRNHTIGKSHWFNCSANPPVKQIHNFFCYCFITFLVRNNPPIHTFNIFFRQIKVFSPSGC